MRWNMIAAAPDILIANTSMLNIHPRRQGAEVALIVRNLLDRLGLAPGSSRLRYIGSSASLEGKDGKEHPVAR